MGGQLKGSCHNSGSAVSFWCLPLGRITIARVKFYAFTHFTDSSGGSWHVRAHGTLGRDRIVIQSPEKAVSPSRGQQETFAHTCRSQDPVKSQSGKTPSIRSSTSKNLVARSAGHGLGLICTRGSGSVTSFRWETIMRDVRRGREKPSLETSFHHALRGSRERQRNARQ